MANTILNRQAPVLVLGGAFIVGVLCHTSRCPGCPAHEPSLAPLTKINRLLTPVPAADPGLSESQRVHGRRLEHGF
jgi:hypothetical protein